MAIDPNLYGIKEVANVTFYDVETGGIPVIFFDTLKISNLEFTGETVYARGGRGNPKKIGWDYNREAILTLQDALFSIEFMELLAGQSATAGATTNALKSHVSHVVTAAEATADLFTLTLSIDSGDGTLVYPDSYVDITLVIDGSEVTIVADNESHQTDAVDYAPSTGILTIENEAPTAGDAVYAVFTLDNSSDGSVLTFSADAYPSTYEVVGDTVIRDTDGNDVAYQFVCHKAKLQPGFTMSMEAEGDPSVFDFTLDVLANEDGDMIDFIKY